MLGAALQCSAQNIEWQAEQSTMISNTDLAYYLQDALRAYHQWNRDGLP